MVHDPSYQVRIRTPKVWGRRSSATNTPTAQAVSGEAEQVKPQVWTTRLPVGSDVNATVEMASHEGVAGPMRGVRRPGRQVRGSK